MNANDLCQPTLFLYKLFAFLDDNQLLPQCHVSNMADLKIDFDRESSK